VLKLFLDKLYFADYNNGQIGFQDRDVKELQELKKLPMEVNFSGRIKDIETKLKEGNQLQKKPKDLMRAIGTWFHNEMYLISLNAYISFELELPLQQLSLLYRSN